MLPASFLPRRSCGSWTRTKTSTTQVRHSWMLISCQSLVSRFASLIVLLTFSGLSPRVLALKCYVCSSRENPNFTLDPSQSFRIVDELAQDHCRYLEEVQCDRDHDICVTIVQYKIDEGKRGPRSYSVAKGCYQSTALDLGGVMYKRGCHKETTEVKEDISNLQFRSRRINIHQAMRYTCVCNANKCNSAQTPRPQFRTCLINLVIIVLSVVLMLRNP